MKIAILLAISVYRGKGLNNLPGCTNDLEMMKALLECTEEYDEIIIPDPQQGAVKLKATLASRLEAFREQKIEQVFFYFSGHGVIVDQSFCYVLSDFDSSRPRQTCIQNDELDDWIRNLQPDLAVKVVDACRSGVAYIKEAADEKHYFERAKRGFGSLYFMCSSRQHQSSYQNEEHSFFTKAFFDSVQEFRGDKLRFKDIIDSIADQFSANPDQAPFFVTQAGHTEIFCSITEGMRAALQAKSKPQISNSLTDGQDSHNVSYEQVSNTVLNRIKADAKSHRTESEAMESLRCLLSGLKTESFGNPFPGVYSLSAECRESMGGLPARKELAIWLHKNRGKYFAKPTYKHLLSADRKRGDIYVVREEVWPGEYIYKTPDGVKHTFSPDVHYLVCRAEPLLANVASQYMYLVYFLSTTEARVFYIFASTKKTSWTSEEPEFDRSWKMTRFAFDEEDSASAVATEIRNGFLGFIYRQLEIYLDGHASS